MPYLLYILRNNEGKLYIGHTHRLERRLRDHASGEAAAFTKRFKDFHLVYSEEYSSQLEAMRRERQLKGWSRAKKNALIAGQKEILKKL
jgi:predicted GIY-YIG superfamily endonuclease